MFQPGDKGHKQLTVDTNYEAHTEMQNRRRAVAELQQPFLISKYRLPSTSPKRYG